MATGAGTPASRRRRAWPARWAGPLAAAAAALVLVGLGVWAVPRIGGDAADTGGAASAPEAATDGAGDGLSGGPKTTRDEQRGGLAALPVRLFTATGADYREDTLARAGRAPQATVKATGPARVLEFGGGRTPVATGSVPAQLRRLTSVPALIACLTAIGDAHPDPAVSVDLIDYASFKGSPALVVVFVDETGARWVWAAGPGCGLPGVGADTRFRAKVG